MGTLFPTTDIMTKKVNDNEKEIVLTDIEIKSKTVHWGNSKYNYDFEEKHWFSFNETIAINFYCKDNNMEFKPFIQHLGAVRYFICSIETYKDKYEYNNALEECLKELNACAEKLETKLCYDILQRETFEKTMLNNLRKIEQSKEFDTIYFHLMKEMFKGKSNMCIINTGGKIYTEPMDFKHIIDMYFDLQKKVREKIKPYEEKVDKIFKNRKEKRERRVGAVPPQQFSDKRTK